MKNEQQTQLKIEQQKQKQREKHQKQIVELALHKAMALEIAGKYCDAHNLSTEKLDKQKFFLAYETATFAQPSDVEPNGLLNDIETVPKPTLILKLNSDGLVVEETEYTRKYLA